MTEADLIHAVFRMQSQTMRRKGDWMVLADPQGRIIAVNPQAATGLGYAQEELIGQPLTVIMPERYRLLHERGINRIRSGGESRIAGKTLPLHALTKDDKEIRINLSVDHFRMEGQGEYAIGSMTERPLVNTRKIMTPAVIFAFCVAFAFMLTNRYLITEVLFQVHGDVTEIQQAVEVISNEPATPKEILDALKIVHENADETLRTIESVIDTHDRR